METLIMFLKPPVLGTVKTRLADSIGDTEALNVYKKLLLQTMRTCRQWELAAPASRRVIPWIAGGASAWLSVRIEFGFPFWQGKLQLGQDLGQKMERALREELQTSERVCVVGTDCPGLRSVDVEQAMLDLHDADVTWGPTFDGGFYLMGVRRLLPGQLTSLPWSASNTLVSTMSRFESFGFCVQTQRTLGDVDEEKDLYLLTLCEAHC